MGGRWDNITTLERFKKHIKLNKVTGCWDVVTKLKPDGYCQFRVNGRYVYIHRWAYENWLGPIPAGMTLDHLCRNKGCANPSHLEPVTLQENILRSNNMAAQHARKTVAICGHPFDGFNGNGARQCNACRKEYMRVYYIEHK